MKFLQWQSERNGIKLDTLKYKIWEKMGSEVNKKLTLLRPNGLKHVKLLEISPMHLPFTGRN